MKVKIIAICLLAGLAALVSCGEEFPPASKIRETRFLGIVASPMEATPGESITFSAVVTNWDGSVYDGPIAWLIVGGDSLRLEGSEDVDPSNAYIQLPGEPDFVWEVPSWDDLMAEYGGREKNGLLLTVAATAFKNGELTGSPIAAFKLFVVSDRSEEERMQNPAFAQLAIVDKNGEQLEVNDDGELYTEHNRVLLSAVPEAASNRYSFHWFSTDRDFIPDFEARQNFEPDAIGLYRIYCIMRQSFFFEHDDESKTRITGTDWRQVEVRFQ